MAGAVRALYLRPEGAAAPMAVPRATAVAGMGFDGDMYSDPLSPRQLLLATTAAYERHALPPNALRENLLLDVDPAVLSAGALLAVGSSAVLRLSFACEACASLDMHKPALSRTIGSDRGVLARVLTGGEINAGDAVRITGQASIRWADGWRERVALILGRVPDGMVVEYRQLARLAGVQSTYCRVFPRIARELGASHKAVGMRSESTLPRWQGHELFD